MNTITLLKPPKVIAKIKYLHAVSIFLPVDAVIVPKVPLEFTLTSIMEKIKTLLATLYSEEETAWVIGKLKNLIQDINYNTHKKSIVIFVSPMLERVYYLEGAVEERIDIDEFFETGDQVFKKNNSVSLPLGEVYS
jgi:hypothetical protein